jgi:hypothetical protein
MDGEHVHPHTGRLTLAAYGVNPVRCRYCQAQIGFVTTTAKGKPMPLDWLANDAGNVRVIYLPGDSLPRALVVEQFELFPPDPDTRWMPHFEKCTPA